MYRNIAEYFTKQLLINQIIRREEYEFYSYGLELFFNKLVFYLTITIISILTDTVLISILFLISFTLLRRYTGGFHCKSAGLCFLVSVLLYLSMILIYCIALNQGNVWIGISILASYIIIIVFSPIESQNKLLLPDENTRYRRLAIFIATIFVLLSFIMGYLNYYDISYALFWSLSADAGLVILHIIKERGKHHEKNLLKSNCKNCRKEH